MIKERKAILVKRLVVLATILIGVILILIPRAKLEIIDDAVYINDYYEYSDTTSCEVELTFNQNVSSGYVTIRFYDNQGKFLEEQEIYLYYSDGNILYNSYVSVDGKVDSYEIISYDIPVMLSPVNVVGILLCVFGILAIFFVLMGLNCKIYYYNDKEIIVYAGYINNYIKVDGVKCDEEKRLFIPHPFIMLANAVYLSCDTGELIEAKISGLKRISVKIDGLLQKPTKQKKEKKENATTLEN